MAVDLDDLRAFLAVATAGSISRGAVRLHRTQPAVSERITRLERHLGTTLFTRTRRGIALTPGGHRLLPYAERCLALIEEAVTAVRADNPRGRVRAVMHATFAPAFVPLVLDSLAPLDLEVACDDAHSEDVVRLLADGAADIGFVYPCPHPHEVTVEPFLHDPFVCVATPDHPLAARRRLHVRDLADGPVAVNAWGDGAKEFLALLRAALIPATRLHPVSPAETAATLARRGSHVGVLTRSTVNHDLASGTLIQLPVLDLPHWQLPVALAYRTRDASTRHVSALRSRLLSTAGARHAGSSASEATGRR
jgi:DNA-binding transcriptional LysR family regulator